jgi:AAA15 family ATPase/GTPase
VLLEFSVNNFKSIKDTAKLSMIATTKDNDKTNFFETSNYKILTSVAIYGANASGKSNLIKAFSYFSSIVLNQFKVTQSTDVLNHTPFKLSNDTENSSGWFEIVFFIENIKYRYGFEIDNNKVYSEWLYEAKTKKESKLFYRDIENEDYVNKNKFKEGVFLFNDGAKSINIADHLLFLWECDRQKHKPIVQNILNYFQKNLNTLDGTKHNSYKAYTEDTLSENTKLKDEVEILMKKADIGIDSINIKKKEIEMQLHELPFEVQKDIPESILKEANKAVVGTTQTLVEHSKFDSDKNKIGSEWFDLVSDESTGTEKFFSILAPILDTLNNGKILIIDELDSSLHPLLAQEIIKMFHNKKINTNKAQLIFATHDTNILKNNIFRRDQIWFAEKDKYGATDIYSLAQFKGIDKKVDFEKQYIMGKYGAIPYIGSFEF